MQLGNQRLTVARRFIRSFSSLVVSHRVATDQTDQIDRLIMLEVPAVESWIVNSMPVVLAPHRFGSLWIKWVTGAACRTVPHWVSSAGQVRKKVPSIPVGDQTQRISKGLPPIASICFHLLPSLELLLWTSAPCIAGGFSDIIWPRWISIAGPRCGIQKNVCSPDFGTPSKATWVSKDKNRLIMADQCHSLS